jgi:hypothetical protein
MERDRQEDRRQGGPNVERGLVGDGSFERPRRPQPRAQVGESSLGRRNVDRGAIRTQRCVGVSHDPPGPWDRDSGSLAVALAFLAAKTVERRSRHPARTALAPDRFVADTVAQVGELGETVGHCQVSNGRRVSDGKGKPTGGVVCRGQNGTRD